MATYSVATPFVPHFTDDSGNLLSGGTLKAFLRGTSTPTNMFSDNSGTSLGATVTLNARGEPQTSGGATTLIYLQDGVDYKFELLDSVGSTLWSLDSIALGVFSHVALAVDIAGVSHPGISTGDVIASIYYDSSHVSGSGAKHRYTGTTTAGKAGNWPDADGYFYDADGKRFSIIDLPVNAAMFGAKGDGVTDDRSAIAAADAAVTDQIVFTGTHFIGSNITVANSIRFLPGATIKADTGVAVTLSKVPEVPDVATIFEGQGTVAISVPGIVWADWWNNDAAESGGNNVMARAFAGTAQGSTINVAGLYDELKEWTWDQQTDRGKSLRGVGAAHPRYFTGSSGHGAHLRSRDDDTRYLLTIGSGDLADENDERTNGLIENVRFDGNLVASDDFGCSGLIKFDGVKDFVLRDINCQYAEEDCITFQGNTSNQITLEGTIECANYKRSGLYTLNSGDGIVTGSLITSGGLTLTEDATDGQVGAIIFNGWKINQLRSYSNQDFCVEIRGIKNSFNIIQADNNEQGAVRFTDAATDNHIGELRANNISTDSGETTANRSIVLIEQNSARNSVGVIKHADEGGGSPVGVYITNESGNINNVCGPILSDSSTILPAQILKTNGNNEIHRMPHYTESATTGAISVNPWKGRRVIIGPMTGNVTISDLGASLGREVDGLVLQFEFIQDGSGSRTVTWGSDWQNTTAISSGASTHSLLTYQYANGTWQEITGLATTGF